MQRDRLVLYSRPGCHLCEEAAVLLDEMVGRERYRTVNIGSDDELLVRYGHRIPVVALDGVDRVEVPITAPDLRDLVAELHRK